MPKPKRSKDNEDSSGYGGVNMISLSFVKNLDTELEIKNNDYLF